MSTVFPLESGRHCGYRLLLLLLMLLVVASLPTGARAQTSQQPGAAAAELTEQQIEQLVLTGQVQH